MKYRLSLATIAARLSVAPTSTAVAFTSNPAFTSSSATHVNRSPSFSVKRPTARTYACATSPLFSSSPTRYLLSYDYIPDVLEKRGPYREGHLGLAKQMLGDEVAVSGGPTLTPGESVPSGGELRIVQNKVGYLLLSFVSFFVGVNCITNLSSLNHLLFLHLSPDWMSTELSDASLSPIRHDT